MNAVAQRLVVGLVGAELHPQERAWLEQWRPAGVILFARNVRDARQMHLLVRELRAVLPDGAEICADHEGGPVSFLQAVVGRPPAPRTLGDLDDPDLTRRVHLETGRRLREIGLDRVLAPCCDVLTEPRNPVIGARAFGTGADRVAQHAAAAVLGLVEAGLAGCVKHWPGHGGTATDTHCDAGGGTTEQARSPFTAALAAGCDAVMVAHLPVADGRPPLSIDPAGVADLREDLGPDVTILSDDISMGALRRSLILQGVPAGDGRDCGLVDPAILTGAWLEAVAAAGCDRLLLRGIPWRAMPLESSQEQPRLPLDTVGPDPLHPGPDASVYAEARKRAAVDVALRPGPDRVLWFDTTGGDRLGDAVALAPLLESWWPRLERLDAQTPQLAPGKPYAAILVTGHRPLTVAHAQLLEPLAAAVGTALTAGHPSLAADLSRLVGPGWRVDGLFDLSGPDLLPLALRNGAGEGPESR